MAKESKDIQEDIYIYIYILIKENITLLNFPEGDLKKCDIW